MIAKGLGGNHIPGRKAVDVTLEQERLPDVTGPLAIKHGIEVKSLLEATVSNSVTVHGTARSRKKAWSENNDAEFHIVIIDDRPIFDPHQAKVKAAPDQEHPIDFSPRKMYYRRGAGNYSTTAVQPVNDFGELKKLIYTPNEKLPKPAQSTVGWEATIAEESITDKRDREKASQSLSPSTTSSKKRKSRTKKTP